VGERRRRRAQTAAPWPELCRRSPYGVSGRQLPNQGHGNVEQATSYTSRGSRAAARKQRWHGARRCSSGFTVRLRWASVGGREQGRRHGWHSRCPYWCPKHGRRLDESAKQRGGETKRRRRLSRVSTAVSSGEGGAAL
jgi:hypothetical protein